METYCGYLQNEDDNASDDWSADEFEDYDYPEEDMRNRARTHSDKELPVQVPLKKLRICFHEDVRTAGNGEDENDEIYDLPDDAKVIINSRIESEPKPVQPEVDENPPSSRKLDIASIRSRFESGSLANNAPMNGLSSNSTNPALQTYDRPKNWERPEPKPRRIPSKIEPRNSAETARGNGPTALRESNMVAGRWPPREDGPENADAISTYDKVPVHNDKQRAIASKLSRVLKGESQTNFGVEASNERFSQSNLGKEKRSGDSPSACPPMIDRSTRPSLGLPANRVSARNAPPQTAAPRNAQTRPIDRESFEQRLTRQSTQTRKVQPIPDEEDYIVPLADAEDEYVVACEDVSGCSFEDGNENYEVPSESPVQKGLFCPSKQAVQNPSINNPGSRQSYADIIICPLPKQTNQKPTQRYPPTVQVDDDTPVADTNYEVPDQIQPTQRPPNLGFPGQHSGQQAFPDSRQRDSFKSKPPPRPDKGSRPPWGQATSNNAKEPEIQSDSTYEILDGGAPPPIPGGREGRPPMKPSRPSLSHDLPPEPEVNKHAAPLQPEAENYDVIEQSTQGEDYEVPDLVDQKSVSGPRCPPEGQENRRGPTSNNMSAFSEEKKLLNNVLGDLTNPQRRNKPLAPMHPDLPSRELPPRDAAPNRLPPRDAAPNRLPPRDAAPNRLPPRDAAPNRLPPRDAAPNRLPPRDADSNRLPQRDATPNMLPPRDAAPSRLPQRDATPNMLPPKDAAPKEPPREPKRNAMEDRRLPPRPAPGAHEDGPILNLNELQNAVASRPPLLPHPANEPSNNNHNKCASVEAQLWFHGNLDKNQAAFKLKRLSKDGAFVIRNTDKIDGYSISIYYQGDVRHLHIFRKQNNFQLGSSEQKFGSVMQLVAYFMANMIELKKGGSTKLTITPPR